MDKQIISERMSIYHKDTLLYSNLMPEEYTACMQDLASLYYQTGSPVPAEIFTDVTIEWEDGSTEVVSKVPERRTPNGIYNYPENS